MSKLKVAVVGAHGAVGRILINQLKNNDSFDKPLAIVRNQDHVTYFEKEIGVNSSLTSLEDASVGDFVKVLEGYDAVVFTAGAGGKGGPGRILTVDLDGADKIVEAAQLAGVKRFVFISSIEAQNREFWEKLTGLRHYYIAKKAAEIVLKASNLDYTIVQPGSLGDKNGTGKFVDFHNIDWETVGLPTVQREDVASFIVASLLNPKKTIGKTVPLINGPVPLDDFLEKL